MYNVVANRWTSINTLNTPPPVAGHSATVIEDNMIVFGGLQKPCTAVHCDKTNDIWILDMKNWTWEKKEIESKNMLYLIIEIDNMSSFYTWIQFLRNDFFLYKKYIVVIILLYVFNGLIKNILIIYCGIILSDVCQWVYNFLVIGYGLCLGNSLAKVN